MSKVLVKDQIPESGQFVAVWEHNGKLWSLLMRCPRPGDYEYWDAYS